MSRNRTWVHQHGAEFTRPPFGGPGTGHWRVGHWQTKDTEPYAVSTLAAGLLESGWREMDEYDVIRAFGPERMTGGIKVDRAFVKSDGSYGHIVTLTKREKGN